MSAIERKLKDTWGQYVTLGIGAEIFAVPVASVREILDLRPITFMPNAPAFLLGLIDVRGCGVPVLDLRVKLGLAAVPPTELTRILVLDIEINGRPAAIGLLVDRVFEVAELEEGQIEAPPDIGVRWRSDYITGIGRRRNDFVVIFDLTRLLAGEDAALIQAAPQVGLSVGKPENA